ncbi:helix-turn-helix domain-containing protein [Dysgonomonas sp. 520]|uniref:helix-turn-helix domain-containing protein n=1 Tax=Dysgonomonas sp. 520 TaxID=2302931 RepID=UPI0013D18F94|nr:helix-turn-helix domain-containing protein [Dysgonomonas sp. 520]NDW08769.1 AraC family transcriptional regulator [Dysgonomonas sp. 520]
MRNREQSPVRFYSLSEGMEMSLKQEQGKILILSQGRIDVSMKSDSSVRMNQQSMVYFPVGEVIVKPLDDSRIVVISFSQGGTKEGKFTKLMLNDVMVAYIELLETYRNLYLKDDYLMQLKLKEFTFLLKSTYTEKQLHAFLGNQSAESSEFYAQVVSLSREIRNAKQLAMRMSYSYSGFNKRFRREFGMPAYQWLKQESAKLIYHEICYTNKSLKQISTDNRFSNLSHFNEFCHRELGASPRQIRKRV